MSDGWLRLLCALAAFAIPLLFAWLVTHRIVRRHRHGRADHAELPSGPGAHVPSRPPRSHASRH